MAVPIRVLLADDHPLVRAGLRATIAANPDIVLVGEATTGDEARHLSGDLLPDVLVLDLSMPGPPALETVAHIRAHWPTLQIVILTAHDAAIHARELVALGATGYVLKDDPLDAVVWHLVQPPHDGEAGTRAVPRTERGSAARPDRTRAPVAALADRRLGHITPRRHPRRDRANATQLPQPPLR